jgi:glycosyltransferase involved in cell wall biosynthesis
MTPRLYLVDQNLTSAQGHHLGYAGAVAEAARASNVATCVLAHASSPGLVGSLPVVPVAPDNYWRQSCAPGGTDPHLHQARGARSLAGAVSAVMAEQQVGADDVLFFPNANLTVLLASALLAEGAGERLPRTVLLFRREWEETSQLSGLPSTEARAVLRQALARLTASVAGSRVRLFTDSEALTDEYLDATRTRVQTAPIPVDARLGPQKLLAHTNPRTLLYLGDARREKGYQDLPEVAAALRGPLESCSLRLVAQSHFNGPEGEPGIAEARNRLRQFPNITLLDAPIDQETYVDHLRRAALVLLPYDARAYIARTSGILAEAICSGTPVVVPAGTWLSTQMQRYGAGMAYIREDERSLAAAVQRALEQLDDLLARALIRAAAFRQFHHPNRLVDFVCGADVLARARGATSTAEEGVA